VSRRRGRLARLLRRALLIALAAPVLWALAYRWADPPATALIVAERLRLGAVAQDWRPLGTISPHLARAVMAAEDARFCDHWGFDLTEIRRALAEAEAGGRRRGASTITQQTAKNVFLWPAADWTRKALEAGFAVLIEALWGKRRIMEVYLNVAEMGPGVFGAQAAARHWFDRDAAALTLPQAARLAAILPAPRARDPALPSDFIRRRAGAVADGARTLAATGRDGCVTDARAAAR